MGGTISVVSTPGQGTTFTATWPITRNAALISGDVPASSVPTSDAPNAAQPSPVNTAAEIGSELLLIEDNPDVVEYLTACCRSIINWTLPTTAGQASKKRWKRYPI